MKLKEEGLTLQQIAEKMNTTVGKVQYRWNKYRLKMNHSAKLAELPERENDQKEELHENFEWTIPPEYNEDDLFSMVHSPTAIFAYWSLSDSKRHMVEHHFRTPWQSLPKRLKVYDVTDIEFHGHNSHRSFEIELPEMTNNWFIRGLEPNRSYCVDLGTKTFDGSFFTILRSNTIETPRIEADSLQAEKVLNWKSGNVAEPEWLENFCSYSYYQKIR